MRFLRRYISSIRLYRGIMVWSVIGGCKMKIQKNALTYGEGSLRIFAIFLWPSLTMHLSKKVGWSISFWKTDSTVVFYRSFQSNVKKCNSWRSCWSHRLLTPSVVCIHWGSILLKPLNSYGQIIAESFGQVEIGSPAQTDWSNAA